MTRFGEILRILATHKVDFIVVGGISAVFNGAPVNTLDLDIVHSRATENIARLLIVLDELGARLSTKGHPLLITRFGPLNILGATGRDMTYDDLLPIHRK